MDKYARFEAWLRQNGARFEQLELREYDCDDGKSDHSSSALEGMNGGTPSSGEEKKETAAAGEEDDYELRRRREGEEGESEMRGVHARQHIPPNTVCMSIPRSCLITVEMGQATPIGQAIYSSDLDLDAPKHIYLMIYILWDRKVNGKNSFFAPYYDILPRTLHNMPIFWTRDELANLEGSYLLHQIADRNQAITEDYQTICSIAPLDKICTLEEFKWARMCVCSRNFGLQIDGHRTSALVPHADMLNHYRPRETKWTFDEDRNAFTITTLQHIPAGAQVYDSYGQKCNHRFLLNYGFAVEENREMDGFCPNEVPLELFVDPDDANFAEKVEFWTRGEIHQLHQQYAGTGGAANPVTQAILTQAANSMQAAETRAYINSNKKKHSKSIGSKFLLSSNGNNNSAHQQHHNVNTNQRFFQQSQSMPLPYHHHHSASAAMMYVNEPAPFAAAPPASTSLYSGGATVVKRVRVCVSNNENTRLLFSLLRTLACNDAELKAITEPLPSAPVADFSAAGNSSSSSEVVSRAIFGFPETLHAGPHNTPHVKHHHATPQQQNPQRSHQVLTGTPTPQAFYRSCRDIRHPISLRNERNAMRLLLDIVGRHLAMYPTTLSQDMADLMDEQRFPRFSNKRHAKIQVRGEKEVLHHYALWARVALDVLDVIADELLEGEQRGGSCAVEVKLTRTGKTVTDVGNCGDGTLTPSSNSFDNMIRRMEEDCDDAASAYVGSGAGPVPIHHTILRYCSDVLGSLRREEFKNMKRLRAMKAREQATRSSSNNSYNRSRPTSGFM